MGRGAAELEAGIVADGRVRAKGAGRKSVEQADPGLWPALEQLVDPETRGDPMSELRWTTKSTTVKLADELTAHFGSAMSPQVVHPVAPAALSKTGATRLSRTSLTLQTLRTIDRRQVHKRAVAQVLITDVVLIDHASAVVAAQWPRWHPTFAADEQGRHDPLIFVEALRQAAIGLAHQVHGVPYGHHFVFTTLSARYLPAWWLTSSDPLHEVQLTVNTTADTRNSVFVGANLTVEAQRDGLALAVARGMYRVLPPKAYERLRGSVRASKFTPAARRAPGAPLLHPRPESGCFELVVDPHEPTYFDHPQDHLPGMLLLAASLEAAGARPHGGGPPARTGWLNLTFHRFGELGHTATVTASQAPVFKPKSLLPSEIADHTSQTDGRMTEIDVIIEQLGNPIATARVGVHHPS